MSRVRMVVSVAGMRRGTIQHVGDRQAAGLVSRGKAVYDLPEREAVPGDTLPDLPDEAYGPDSTPLPSQDDDDDAAGTTTPPDVETAQAATHGASQFESFGGLDVAGVLDLVEKGHVTAADAYRIEQARDNPRPPLLDRLSARLPDGPPNGASVATPEDEPEAPEGG